MLVIDERRHIIGRKSSGKDVNEARNRLKSLVDKMSKVIFSLLYFLDVDNLIEKRG